MLKSRTDSVPLARPLAPAAVSLAAALALAVAMGIGRFAFTPLLPLMVRDGLVGGEGASWLASANYLGYFLGAMLAGRLPLSVLGLLRVCLLGIPLATLAMGVPGPLTLWLLLRFLAGVLSAWALVATSSWALVLLAEARRSQLAGLVYAGVGLGIAGAGLFCLLAARPGVGASWLWVELGLLTALVAAIPLLLTRGLAAPRPAPTPGAGAGDRLPAGTGGLVWCYGIFGFGYILPATFLPVLARRLVDDPQVFGWAWPLFGLAAALSTVLSAWTLGRLGRLRLWALCQGVMALGTLLPSLWHALPAIALSALLVGGTFMVATMAGMQEARQRAPAAPTALLARMTAAFALGQLAGPLVTALLARLPSGPEQALDLGLQLAALSLALSAAWLWRASLSSSTQGESR